MKKEKKQKEQKQYKGMTAPVDVVIDVPDDEIWTYQIEGLAAPHINKPFENFMLKKVIFTVLILIAVFLSMYFSVRVVSRAPFEFNQNETGYEFTKFNNTGYIKELEIDYATELVTNKEVSDPEKNFTLKKDETKPVTSIAEYCFNCDEVVQTIYIGKDVKEIDGKAFYTCRALRQIIVDEENEYFSDIEGVLYNKDKTEIICYPMNHSAYLREKHGYNDVIWPEMTEMTASGPTILIFTQPTRQMCLHMCFLQLLKRSVSSASQREQLQLFICRKGLKQLRRWQFSSVGILLTFIHMNQAQQEMLPILPPLTS